MDWEKYRPADLTDEQLRLLDKFPLPEWASKVKVDKMTVWWSGGMAALYDLWRFGSVGYPEDLMGQIAAQGQEHGLYSQELVGKALIKAGVSKEAAWIEAQHRVWSL